MTFKTIKFGLFCAAIMLSNQVHSSLLAPVSVTDYGDYYNSATSGAASNANNLIDGVFSNEWAHWQDKGSHSTSTNTGLTTYWYYEQESFVIDYGQVVTIDDVLLSIDNNDSYAIDYSMDSVSWSNLFNISVSDGNVGWGMDTMSTDSGHSEYVSTLDFTSVNARYLSIRATGGDHLYWSQFVSLKLCTFSARL